MVHLFRSEVSGYVRVVFELSSGVSAENAYVVGDFNKWSRTATPMNKDSQKGNWIAVLVLPMGQRYAFHYLIDGSAHMDSYTRNIDENDLEREGVVITPSNENDVLVERDIDLVLKSRYDFKGREFLPLAGPDMEFTVPVRLVVEN